MKTKHLLPILFISLILTIQIGFAAETEDLRRNLRERTTQMGMDLGVAAVAVAAVFVVFWRNRSG